MDNVKILAVDDEESALNIIKTLLRHFDVTTVTSSIEAAEMIKQERYDIYIVDYQMPGFNGIDLLNQVRERYKDKDYINIFCTAYGTIYLFKIELIKGVFDFFIEKPFETDNFKKVFEKAIIELGKRKNK